LILLLIRQAIYISDQGNYTIRKINTFGIINTIAGNGVSGFPTYGGLATATSLYRVWGVCIDTSGNVYQSDWSSGVVNKINTSGIISKIAGSGSTISSGDGGLATAAGMAPWAIMVDSIGNIYVSDAGGLGSSLRKINTSGIIQKIAGSETSTGFSGDGGSAMNALFNNPKMFCFDSLENIFFVDEGNSRIRKISNNGIISTVVGNSGYGGDGGPAITALLQSPTDVCKDKYGNIYIADVGSHTIRKVNTAGIISTIAGTGVAGNSGDGGPATIAELNDPIGVVLDTNGNIYISDDLDNKVRRIDGVTGIITSFAGTGISGYSGNGGTAGLAQLNSPMGLAIDTSGNLYISDKGNNVIRKVDVISNSISLYAGNTIAALSGDNGPATAASLNGPAYIAFDQQNNLYIADENNNVVRKVDGASSIISTFAGNDTCTGALGDGGPALAATICSPVGVAVDDTGNVSITTAGRVRHVTSSTGTVTTAAGNGKIGMTPDGTGADSSVFNGASGICFDAVGHLLIADRNNRVVRGKGLPVEVKEIGITSSMLRAFPNPNNGTFEISGIVTEGDAKNELTATVTNMLGQVVYQTRLSTQNHFAICNISLNGSLSEGVYYCNISGSNIRQTIKVLKIK